MITVTDAILLKKLIFCVKCASLGKKEVLGKLLDEKSVAVQLEE